MATVSPLSKKRVPPGRPKSRTARGRLPKKLTPKTASPRQFWLTAQPKSAPHFPPTPARSTTHNTNPRKSVLCIRIEAEAKKHNIKVRLLKPDLLEIEWPRSQGEEIPVG
jgi:hypothetical protein